MNTYVNGLENSGLLRRQSFPKMIYEFNLIMIKISAGFSVEIDKPILKFIWKCNGSGTAKTTLKNNEVRGLMLLDFKS